MNPDDTICFCFHVSCRKLRNYARHHKPSVPSLMSECLGAGTGCGWCRPLIVKIWEQDGQKGEPKDEKGQDGEHPQPEPGEPEKKKEGELKEAPQFDKDSKEGQDAAEQAEAEAAAAEGRMTERQAKSLLDSLKAEDAKVHLLDPREQKRPGRVIRDW